MKSLKQIIILILLCHEQSILRSNNILNQKTNINDAMQVKEEQIKNIEKELGNRSLSIFFDPFNIDGYNGQVCHPYAPQGTLWLTLKPIMINATSPFTITRNLWDELINCPYMADIAPRWHIYASNDQSLIIFIPRGGIYEKYLGMLNDFNLDEKISDGQFLLGIKLDLNPNKEITLKSQLPPHIHGDSVAKYLNEILITKNDLHGSNEQYLNRWDIYLVGHGIQDMYIAGMPVQMFDRLLNFLNTNINTRTLLYVTCFAGGENLQKPYQYTTQQEKREKNLNFTVMSGTTFSKAASLYSINDSKYGILGIINIDGYFQAINQYFDGEKMITLPDAIKNILQWGKTYLPGGSPNELMLPTIRFPNTERFVVTDFKRVFLLNDSAIMRAINTKINKISIPDSIKVILVESCYIPIPLEIEDTDMPLLAPLDVNGDYFFKEIRAPKVDIASPKFNQKNDTDDLLSMLVKLGIKLPADTGNPQPSNDYSFLIEKLIMKLSYQNTDDSNPLNWGSEALDFNTVILKTDFILLTHAKTFLTFDFEQNHWVIVEAPKGDAITKNFYNGENRIRTRSKLPESMLAENPAPIIQHPLLYEYMTLKDKPQYKEWKKKLTPEQQIKLERLIQMNPMVLNQKTTN